MTKKAIRRFAVAAILFSLVLGSFCAMMGGGHPMVFLACWLVVGAAILFGWIIGAVMGESNAKAVWRDRCVRRVEAWKIRDGQVFTKEAASWNSAINRAAYEIQREFEERGS